MEAYHHGYMLYTKDLFEPNKNRSGVSISQLIRDMLSNYTKNYFRNVDLNLISIINM